MGVAQIRHMNDVQIDIADEDGTRSVGKALGATLRSGDVVCLTGPLGAGKTTLARAVLSQAVGALEAPSPTFSLVETYQTDAISVWHFDLYRLEAPADVWELGLEEALETGACLIEWPEKIASYLPENILVLNLKPSDTSSRVLTIRAQSAWFKRLHTAGIT